VAYTYVDTSALAKWYLPEAGSDKLAAWMQQQKDTCISSLTITEFRCLLARRQRMGLLSGEQVQELYAIFQQDCRDGHLLHFPVTDQNVINAELMIESLPNLALRTLDGLAPQQSACRSTRWHKAAMRATPSLIILRSCEGAAMQRHVDIQCLHGGTPCSV